MHTYVSRCLQEMELSASKICGQFLMYKLNHPSKNPGNLPKLVEYDPNSLGVPGSTLESRYVKL